MTEAQEALQEGIGVLKEGLGLWFLFGARRFLGITDPAHTADPGFSGGLQEGPEFDLSIRAAASDFDGVGFPPTGSLLVEEASGKQYRVASYEFVAGSHKVTINVNNPE